MDIKSFLLKMKAQGSMVDSSQINFQNVLIDDLAKRRLSKSPSDFIEFITSYSCFQSGDETMWFLSYADYLTNLDAPFNWNEFENQSLECAEGDNMLLESIRKYWDNHIPFFMSVRGEYSYLAICVDEDNYGKIYQGFEPEYEEVSLYANSLDEFFEKFAYDQLIE